MFLGTRKVRKRQRISNKICMDLGYIYIGSGEEEKQEKTKYTLFQMVTAKKHEVPSLEP